MSDAKKKLGEYTPLLQPDADSAEPQPEASTSLSTGGLPSTGVNVGVFNDGHRPYQDRKWSWAFFGTLALVGVFGFVLGFTRDSNSFFLDASSPATCPVNLQHQSRSLLELDDDVTAVPTMHPVWLVLGAFLCAFATGWLFVLGFKHRADLMVQVAIWSQISLFVLLGVGSLVSSPDSPMGGIILLALGGLWAYLLLKAWQPQIRLVTRLLALAGQAISENTGLVGLSVALQAGWGLLAIPTFTVLLFVALQNGHWSQNAAVFTLQRPAGTSASHAPVCMDQAGHTVDCCTWQVHGGAIAYMVLLGVAGCWAAMILDQVKHFTVAGTVAQWYFTPTLPGASCGSLPARSRVATSLRHALGPSFGSLCAAGALLAVVTFLKRMLAAQERRMARGGVAALFAMVLVWLLRLLLSFVEFMTKFTTVRMAVTGEAFFDAARNTYDLLKRNAMDALGMWWLPTLVLGNCALVASLAYGCLVAGLSQLLWGDAAPAGLWWALSWLVSFLAIMFFCQLLLISVDTLFLAAAMDRDAARVTRQEVHDLLKEVPGLQGALVEQPDGNLAYGSQPVHAAGVQRPATAVV